MREIQRYVAKADLLCERGISRVRIQVYNACGGDDVPKQWDMFVKDTFAALDRLLRTFFELQGTHLTVNECIKFMLPNSVFLPKYHCIARLVGFDYVGELIRIAYLKQPITCNPKKFELLLKAEAADRRHDSARWSAYLSAFEGMSSAEDRLQS